MTDVCNFYICCWYGDITMKNVLLEQYMQINLNHICIYWDLFDIPIYFDRSWAHRDVSTKTPKSTKHQYKYQM